MLASSLQPDLFKEINIRDAAGLDRLSHLTYLDCVCECMGKLSQNNRGSQFSSYHMDPENGLCSVYYAQQQTSLPAEPPYQPVNNLIRLWAKVELQLEPTQVKPIDQSFSFFKRVQFEREDGRQES